MWIIRRRWNIDRTEFLLEWNELCLRTAKGDRLRVQSVGTPPPDDTERALLSDSTPSGFPQGTRAAMLSGATPSQFPKRTRAAMLSGLSQGEAHDTCEHYTPDDSISYPDMLSELLTKVSKPCYSPRSAALRWCVRAPYPDIFCHGFQITLLNLGLLWWSKSYQNTKTSHNLIRIDCKGP